MEVNIPQLLHRLHSVTKVTHLGQWLLGSFSDSGGVSLWSICTHVALIITVFFPGLSSLM